MAVAQAPLPDIIVPNSPSDSVSSLHFAPRPVAPELTAPSSDLLASSSWDGSVCVWRVQSNMGGGRDATVEAQPLTRSVHQTPVLCSAWSEDGSRIVSGGCDNLVKLWQVESNQTATIGQHDEPVKCVLSLPASTNLPSVLTGSWDKTIRYWDPRQAPAAGGAPNPALTVSLPAKVYAMDQAGMLLAVATSDRHIYLYDLRKPQEAWKRLSSPLKFQSRSIAIHPKQDGFCLGSIEGRVAVHYVHETPVDIPQKDNEPPKKMTCEERSFAYKCHRRDASGSDVYAINSILFHPRHHTFATLGSDGTFAFWDKDAKQRLKQFDQLGNAVLCGAFNPSGTILAYAVGMDPAAGLHINMQNQQSSLGASKTTPNHIALHRVQTIDIQRRG